MIKKISALLCVVCLICGFQVRAFAETAAVSSLSVKYYETVQAAFIDVTVSCDFSCAGIQGTLCYDNTVLRFESASQSSLDDGTDSFVENNTGLKFILLGDVANGTEGEWFTVTFRVIKQGRLSAQFSLLDAKGVSMSAVAISLSCQKSQTETHWITGDVNGDGKVNIMDIVRMKRYFAGLLHENQYSPLNANCNGDSQLDAEDMTSLRSILLQVF